MAKNLILWVVIAIVLMSVFNNFGPPAPRANTIGYSDFIAQVKSGQVSQVVIQERHISGQLSSGERFQTYAPDDPRLIDDLLANNVKVIAKPRDEQGLLTQIFISWFPMLLLIGVWIFFMRQMQGGGGGRGAMSFGKSRARMLGEDQLNAARYPSIEFRSRSVRATDEGFEIEGDLTLVGVTRPVTVPVRLRRMRHFTIFEGVFAIRQRDFGIEPVSVGGVIKVADEVRIRFELWTTPGGEG